MGTIGKAFTPAMRARLRRLGISAQALSTPLMLTDELANGVTAALRYSPDRPGEEVIAINGRYLLDPEFVAHDLAEETAHAQQLIDGIDFDKQQAEYAYDARPYEIEAKRLADEACGYGLPNIPLQRLRPELPGTQPPKGVFSEVRSRHPGA